MGQPTGAPPAQAVEERIQNVIKRADERVKQSLKMRDDALQTVEVLKQEADAAKKAAAERVEQSPKLRIIFC
ncbi:hypothetical protein AAVH_39883 [Aphelenchoides avenae]|nr:hypothetical protein AAVH_39883 [Aphelenchus avenae]